MIEKPHASRQPPTACLLMTLGCVLLTACGRSAADQARQAAAEVRSWDATLDLVARQRASGSLPQQFAQQVRRRALEGRAQAEAKRRKASAP
jgi:hypothetical protein